MNRVYTQSHPWISFELNLAAASASLWMLLGEAKSKCDHISLVPLPPDVAARLHRLSLIKGIAGTTAIEGNTLTEAEIGAQLDGVLQLPKSKEYQRQEVQNINDAVDAITKRVFASEDHRLTPELIHEFNRLVLHKLELEPHIEPGRVRNYSVMVASGRYRGAPAEDCAWLLERLCDWLNDFNPAGYPPIVISLIKAILAHLYIAWIHPYGDGNGRTARLIEVFILLNGGAPTPAAHLLSNHYNETRSLYYGNLAAARTNPLEFVRYAVDGFVEGLKWQIMHMRTYQWRAAWHDFLRTEFDSQKKMDQRHLLLLQSLPPLGDKTVTPAQAAQLTPQLATIYAKLADKTVYRDITHLETKELVMILDGYVMARTDRVFQFFPPRKTNTEGLFDALMPAKLRDAMLAARNQHDNK